MPKIEAPCVCCGTAGTIVSRMLINACYKRNRRAGTLDNWPRVSPAVPDRIEDARFLYRQGLSTEEVWVRLGYSGRRSFLESMRQAVDRGHMPEKERVRWARS